MPNGPVPMISPATRNIHPQSSLVDVDSGASTVVVLDFETTGLSPDHGDRAIEIGAVKLVDGVVVDRFQQLMNPGRKISFFIEGYTGITNGMLQNAPSCEETMCSFAQFIQDFSLVAHNASFDARFLRSEFERIHHVQDEPFACSMLASRRIYPDAPNHKLETLIHYKKLPTDGNYHRALADAEMTAHLWKAILDDISTQYNISHIPFRLMQKLTRTAKQSVPRLLSCINQHDERS